MTVTDKSCTLTLTRYIYPYLIIVYALLSISRYEYSFLMIVREVLSPILMTEVTTSQRSDITDSIETLLTTDESHILASMRNLYVYLKIVREVIIPSIEDMYDE
jgi:hypothetical protein